MTFTSFPVPGTASGGPPGLMSGTIPGNGSGLILAWTGSDSAHEINIQSSSTAGKWGSKSAVPGASAQHGASLVHFGSQDFIGWSATSNGQIYVAASTSFGATWGAAVAVPGAIGTHQPAFAPLANGQLALVWADAKTSQINLIFSTDGIHWTGRVTSTQTTTHAPYLATFEGLLWILWTDASSAVNLMSYNAATTASPWGAKVTIPGSSSVAGPSALGTGSAIRIAWAGAAPHNYINCQDFNGKTFASVSLSTPPPVTAVVPTLSNGYPATANQVALAWTANNGQVNVGTFS